MQVEHMIAAVAEITGTELSPQAIAMMAGDLAEHPSADVMEALTRCRRELKGRLTLAEILERLPTPARDPNSTISPETIERARLTRKLMEQKRLEPAPAPAMALKPASGAAVGKGGPSRPLPRNFNRPAIPAEVLEKLPPIPERV